MGGRLWNYCFSKLESNLDKSEFVLNVSKNGQTIGFINESLMIINAGGFECNFFFRIVIIMVIMILMIIMVFKIIMVVIIMMIIKVVMIMMIIGVVMIMMIISYL